MHTAKALLHPDDLVDRVCNTLRDAICSGQLAPGTRLTQDQLADQLKMSRQPVLLAVRMLMAEGLLRPLGRKAGMEVTEVTPPWVNQIASVRQALMTLAAVQATAHFAALQAGRPKNDSDDATAPCTSPQRTSIADRSSADRSSADLITADFNCADLSCANIIAVDSWIVAQACNQALQQAVHGPLIHQRRIVLLAQQRAKQQPDAASKWDRGLDELTRSSTDLITAIQAGAQDKVEDLATRQHRAWANLVGAH